MNHDLQINQNAEQTYHSIRNSIVSAQHRLSAAINSTMVITYWEIGEQIYKACGENDRAEYGKKLLQYLSEQLTAEFGKGFSVQGLRNMRQFYCTFPIRSTLWSELEQALINHLQHFLLELGRGFSFVARQKRFTLDGQDFFIDLVFYNYILKCFVLIDLKMGKLTHQDLGQMQMYVNYYTREMMNDGDTPPISIVLCADKGDSIVKYTLSEDNHQIFASKYFT